jgi:hypothetical protein
MISKEDLAIELYSLCNDKTKNSKEIAKLLIDIVGEHRALNKQCIEMEIHKYKQRGKGLEEAVDNILVHIRCNCDTECDLMDDNYDFKP